MDDLNASNLANHIQYIAQTYYDLIRINVAQAGSKARATLFFVLAGLVLCILLLAGIGLSLYLGKLLNNAAAGYFTAGGLLCRYRGAFVFASKNNHIPNHQKFYCS